MVRDFDLIELQADELCTFIDNKSKTVWLFATIEVSSRLWAGSVLGRRADHNARTVISDAVRRGRVVGYPLIATDGFEYYAGAVGDLFGAACVFGQVLKTRRNNRVVRVERRVKIGTAARLKAAIVESEDSETLNTSFIERLNLTIRQASAYLFRHRMNTDPLHKPSQTFAPAPRRATPSRFVKLFQVPENRARAKFLARVFGIFSEDIVRRWSKLAGAPYEDLGRPTVRFDDDEATRPPTLDFTLRERNKESNKTYVAEMKCEIEYEKFKYFVLTSPEQLKRHMKKPAFRSFLRTACKPSAARVTVVGLPVPVDGAILIWGAATPKGCADVREKFKLADVLTVESMVDDLTRSNDEGYVEMLKDRRKWINEMFDGLATGEPSRSGRGSRRTRA